MHDVLIYLTPKITEEEEELGDQKIWFQIERIEIRQLEKDQIL